MTFIQMVKENLKKIFTLPNLLLVIILLSVVAILCSFQIGIFNQNVLVLFGISTQDFTNQFLLKTSNPTIISAFTTNYLHFEQGHLFGNLGGFVVITGVILLIYFIREIKELKIPKIYFFLYALFAFLILPFIISLVSCMVQPAETVNGFSGIMFSCLGAAIALSHPLIYLLLDKSQKIHRRKYLRQILSYVILLISFIAIEIYFALYDLASPNNAFVLGHITGACCGFLFTLIFEYYYRKKYHLQLE